MSKLSSWISRRFKDNTTKVERKDGVQVKNLKRSNVTINQGLSYTECREIAKDVYEASFYRLAGIAKEIADERAGIITEKILKKLQNENPNGFDQFKTPDFQYGIFTVQREFARNGDKDLGELLVDLLVDRSKQEQRNILQIVLNESLNIAPKLTNDQLAALAVIFLFRHTQNHTVRNHELLGEYFDKHILPFVEKLNANRSCCQHLEYSGCGSAGLILGGPLEAILGTNYQGLFFNGFDKNGIAEKGISIGLDTRFFVECLNNPSKIQIKALTRKSLEKNLMVNQINAEDTEKIIALFEYEKMSDIAIRNKCISIRPYMEKVFDIWNSSDMQSFSLTSVGIAIGHANVKRLMGEFTNLSIWIN